MDINGYRFFVYLPNFEGSKASILSNKDYDVSIEKLQIKVIPKQKNGKVFWIPLKSKLKDIIQSKVPKSSFPIDKMTITNDNYKLIINSIRGNYYSRNDSIFISSCDALLFIK